jgi:hypothetical protein
MTLNPFLYFSIGVVEKGEVVHRMGESPLTGAVPVSHFFMIGIIQKYGRTASILPGSEAIHFLSSHR